MTERISKKLEFLKKGEYKTLRKNIKLDPMDAAENEWNHVAAARFAEMHFKAQTPVIFEDDKIGFNIDTIITRLDNKLQPFGLSGNICPDYDGVLKNGFNKYIEDAKQKLLTCSEDKKDFYNGVIISLNAALELANRYKIAAKNEGATELYDSLTRVPHAPAKTFLDVCVFVKFIQFTTRLIGHSHITIGRFDQYAYPYFLADLNRGVDEQVLLETLEEFFISLNIDSDTYIGMQQGDNGQSIMLGGYDQNGNDMYNKLSEFCMRASLELNVIDPKINLRVSSKTPIERLEFATELTKKGLGFPQYNNDDVVVPGLISLGYDPEDAYNYTVAACWEFIMSGNGADIPNVTSLSFLSQVKAAIDEKLLACNSFDQFLGEVKINIAKRCDQIIEETSHIICGQAPYLSALVEGCIEKGLDMNYGGAKYRNYGAHGTGIAVAADSLMAIKTAVFDEKVLTKEQLLEALDKDFVGFEETKNYLLSIKKMGNNDDEVDAIAAELMDAYAENFNLRKNAVNGIYKAGTGSAMYHIWDGAKTPATPDGRNAFTPVPSSFSPSLTAKLEGPISCIKSFTKYDMKKIINGGPLTMEIHDTVFHNPDGIKKVAALVKLFLDRGGHQLQINSINREVLLDAKKNAELYKNLIVRVWGWSGYFCELSPEYQDHIISRTEFR